MTALPREEVERMILASRERLRNAQLLGHTRLVPIYEHQLNRWLDLWIEMRPEWDS